MEENENGNAQRFLELIRRSRRGKFKIYIGMIAGVGKTYRMLSEAHDLLKNGIDVQIGYVETHGRPGTVAMLEGLPVIPRKKVFYKGKEIEEMDLETILQAHPELVIVDELAHTNVEGSRNTKRWEDVMELLDAGINLQNVTTAIGFLTQRTIEQLEGITIMCDGQEVHECTTSEQMIELLQSGKAIFGVSVGSLWRQIKDALGHEEYVDLTKLQTSTDGKRPIDDIAAMRMRKKLEAQRKARAASGR